MIRPATLVDIPYLEHLRRKEGNSIGFIPIQRYEMEINRERHGSILVYEENGDLVGFIYATHNRAGVTHIQQVAIQEDARRLERATALTQAIEKPTDWLISLRCAADLEATDFWEALGFKFQGHVEPKSVYGKGKNKKAKSKRDILKFQKVTGGLWLPAKDGIIEGDAALVTPASTTSRKELQDAKLSYPISTD